MKRLKELERPLKAGDMIITDFWGLEEVCKVYKTVGQQATLIRLESIVHQKDAKSDYCLAVIDEDISDRFPYRFLHESKWYLTEAEAKLSNQIPEKLFYIISYKNSTKGVLTFWGANNAGYYTNIELAGKYPESKVRAHMDYYHQGEGAIAISVEEVHSGKFKVYETVQLNYLEKPKHFERVKLGILEEVKEEVPDAQS